MPSWDLSIDEMADIAARVRLAVAAGSTGVVVTHGTDTMEETTWLTELMLGAGLRGQAAVLFTGAMRFADHPAGDGAANLGFALKMAQEGLAVGNGVRVAWQGKLHAVRSLRKVDAAAVEPFISRSQGGSPAGLPEPGPKVGPNVELLKVGPLSRPRVPDDVAGLVLEGTGAAHVPSSYNETINRLVSGGVPVVLGSRCRDVERDPDSGPVLYAGDLRQKSRNRPHGRPWPPPQPGSTASLVGPAPPVGAPCRPPARGIVTGRDGAQQGKAREDRRLWPGQEDRFVLVARGSVQRLLPDPLRPRSMGSQDETAAQPTAVALWLGRGR